MMNVPKYPLECRICSTTEKRRLTKNQYGQGEARQDGDDVEVFPPGKGRRAHAQSYSRTVIRARHAAADALGPSERSRARAKPQELPLDRGRSERVLFAFGLLVSIGSFAAR